MWLDMVDVGRESSALPPELTLAMALSTILEEELQRRGWCLTSVVIEEVRWQLTPGISGGRGPSSGASSLSQESEARIERPEHF